MNNEQCRISLKTGDLLHLILDGEATAEDQTFYYQHIMECAPCSMDFQFQKTIREVLRHKLSRKEAPEEMIRNIQNLSDLV